MKTDSFTVRASEARATLQDFLVRRLSLSRNGAKTVIDSRNVLVNGRRVWMARHALAAGDRVEVLPAAPDAAADEPCAILYEDGDYLVADKRPGLPSNGPYSLEERLRRQFGEESLAAAHRLDRDTSGCLLVARNGAAFDAAVRAFRAGRVSKTYHAIVARRLAPAERTITAAIEGKRAVTHVRVLDAGREASHLLLTIATGRTHQIRRHLALIHHPVLGDRQYGTGARLPPRSLELPRQMLHAFSLELPQPLSGRPIQAVAPLPADFRRALALFRLR